MGARSKSPVRAMVTALDALVIVLVVLTVAIKLGPAGWLAGVAFAVIGWAALVDGLSRYEVRTFGSVGRVTLARGVLVGGLATLVVETTDPRPDPVLAIVILAAAVLAAMALGAWVTSRGGTVSEFDARFAVEVDAFFVLVLSAFAVKSLGVWVLAIGGLRYAFVVAGRFVPWLREPLPPRRLRGIIAAAQGIVLAVVGAGVLPRTVAIVLTALALGVLVGSFADDIRRLHRNRPEPVTSTADDTPTDKARPSTRRILAWVVTGLAGLLVLTALVGPNRLSQLTFGAFTRIPVEGLMGAALVLILPARARRVAVVVIGAGLGLLTIVKMFDMGFYEVFDRPFHPIFDWSFLGPAVDFVGTSYGKIGEVLAVVGAILLVIALLVLTTLAVRRLTRLAVGHRTGATRLVATLGIIWLVCALAGIQLTPQEPVASRSAADHVYDDVRQVRQGLGDSKTFAAQSAVDKYRYTPGKDLLTALRGKDVLFVFVESYGRVAVEDSTTAPKVDPLLDEWTDRLDAKGFNSRSAFLTSPTYGGGSWLAHATLQTGLWVDNTQRRFTLNSLDRTTLSIAFNRAGWRTVGDVPANTEDWPDGDMFHYDQVYDSRNVGYKGPKFGYGPVPDQYTLQAFQHRERDAHGPVMAEIDLVTSHTPFTPIPDYLDWDKVGNGSVYDPMPAKGPQPSEVWPDPTKVRDAYTASIEYSLKSLLSYIEKYGDDNLVVVYLGDHQPQPIVAAQENTRDVPVTIVAKDPAVTDRVSSWGWTDGLNPDPKAPVWPMDAFRDKFLGAYGPKAPSNTSASPR